MRNNQNEKSALLASVLEGDQNLFRFTSYIYFELSNLCNYASIHTRCPLYTMRDQTNILSGKIVYDALETMGKYNYSDTICFHSYNEPLIDPRLFEFIRTARKMCPKSNISIWTNGYYLNQGLALELVEAGVTEFIITAYTQSEKERFEKIRFPVSYKIQNRSKLDGRRRLYNKDRLFDAHCNKPCFAPLHRLAITAKGKINLCCYEWKRQHPFGNLYKQSFEEVMKNDKMWLVYEQLSKGIRLLDFCKHCSRSR